MKDNKLNIKYTLIYNDEVIQAGENSFFVDADIVDEYYKYEFTTVDEILFKHIINPMTQNLFNIFIADKNITFERIKDIYEIVDDIRIAMGETVFNLAEYFEKNEYKKIEYEDDMITEVHEYANCDIEKKNISFKSSITLKKID